MKIKVVLAVFAVVILLYVIHFVVAYINSKKKDVKEEDEKEQFVDKDDKEPKDPSYKVGLQILDVVDKMNLPKSQKTEVVKELFSEVSHTDNLQSIKKKAEDVVQKVTAKKTSEQYEDPIVPSQEQPKATPEEKKANQSESKCPEVGYVKKRLEEIKANVDALYSSFENFTEESADSRKKLPILPKKAVETFAVEGFENHTRYALFA